MKRTKNQAQNIIKIIGSNEEHQPFVCQIDCKKRRVKYINRIKNGAQQILYFFYQRAKTAFKKIKLFVLYSQKSLIEENLFFPGQLLKGNNQIHSTFLQSLRNNKFDSYISLKLTKFKNIHKSSFNFTPINQVTTLQTNSILPFHNKPTAQTNSILPIHNKRNLNIAQTNHSINVNTNAYQKDQFQSKVSSRTKFNLISKNLKLNKKQNQTNYKFFSQNYFNSSSSNHKHDLNDKEDPEKQRPLFEFDKANKQRKNNIKDNLKKINITYTCIQKNIQQGRQKQMKFECSSRVSQTLSSNSIKKEKSQIKDQTFIISNYLTPKINKRNCDD